MNNTLLIYSIVMLVGVFVSAISQVLLKKSALKSYKDTLHEYLNPLVIVAYILFFISTLIGVYAYKVVPLSLGPVLEATSYIYITFFSVKIFGERLNKRKIFSLILILSGIIVCSVFGG